MAATTSSFALRSTVSHTFKPKSILPFANQTVRFGSNHVTGSKSLVCSSLKTSLCAQASGYDLNGKATAPPSHKVAIIGSPHGIGEDLSAALRESPAVSQLRFYSIGGLDHLKACFDATHSPQLKEFLKGVDVVVICPRVVESVQNEFFANATIVKACLEALADFCPDAFIIIANPFLNSVIPMAAELLTKRNVYDHNKLFGLMTPEVELARAFVAQRFVLDVDDVDVPVVGGHSSLTALPLFSKTNPHVILYEQDRILWTSEIQYCVLNTSEHLDYFAGNPDREHFEVRGAERFVLSVLRALDGDEDIFQCGFVESTLTDVPFFGSTIKLGKNGVKGFVETDLEGLAQDEARSLKYLKEDLMEDIEKGVKFANKAPEAY